MSVEMKILDQGDPWPTLEAADIPSAISAMQHRAWISDVQESIGNGLDC